VLRVNHQARNDFLIALYYDRTLFIAVSNAICKQHPTLATAVFLAINYPEFLAARAGEIKITKTRSLAVHRRHQFVCFGVPSGVVCCQVDGPAA
jgi:hypothetical protein